MNVIAAPYENYIDITLPNESTKQRRKYNIKKKTMHSHSPTATTKQSPKNLFLLNFTPKKDETSLPSLPRDQDQSVAVPG